MLGLSRLGVSTPGPFLLSKRNPDMTKQTKGWTPERRAAQRERMLKNKPWEKSTGPRTRRGKKISSANATKHGLHSAEIKAIRKILSEQSAFIDDCKLFERMARKTN